MGTKELAKRYQVADAVAAKFVATFHGAFPAVKQWTAHVKRQCHVQGFVTTITQRRRLVARAADGDGAAKARQDRQAVNSVVQGSASDIMKLAMIDIHHKLDHDTTEADPATASSSAAPAISRPPPPRMILQVHDELIFEVAAQPKAIAQLVTTVRHCMEVEVVASLGLKVPLVVTTMVGPSWGNMRAFVGSSAGSIAVAPAAAGGGPPQAQTRQSSSPHTPPPLPLGPTQRGQQPSQQQCNHPLQQPPPSHFPTSSPFFATRASQGAPSTTTRTQPPVLFSQ
jgi:type IV secretory pathway TrbL component